MSINIQPRTDYSFLFSSLGSGAAGVSGSNFLIDYALIKSGSYGKLMKAYYSQDSNDSVNKLVSSTVQNAAADTDKTALNKVQTTTDALKESADTLLENGSKSVFAQKDITTTDENGAETTRKGYDVEGIYKAVSDFVTNYNSVIKAADDSGNEKVMDKTVSLATSTYANSKLLGKIGITINGDSTLSIDKDTFIKADMGTVKSLFNGNGSYGYRASAQASLIQFTADREASKSSLYNMNGTLYNTYGTGSLFNGFF